MKSNYLLQEELSNMNEILCFSTIYKVRDFLERINNHQHWVLGKPKTKSMLTSFQIESGIANGV